MCFLSGIVEGDDNAKRWWWWPAGVTGGGGGEDKGKKGRLTLVVLEREAQALRWRWAHETLGCKHLLGHVCFVTVRRS